MSEKQTCGQCRHYVDGIGAAMGDCRAVPPVLCDALAGKIIADSGKSIEDMGQIIGRDAFVFPIITEFSPACGKFVEAK